MHEVYLLIENDVVVESKNDVSPILAILSISAFILLQSSLQIHFVASDSDYGSRVTSIVWSPNRESVAVTTQDGDVRLWDVTKGGSFSLYPTQGQNTYNHLTGVYNTASWSFDGRYIAFGDNDSIVRVLDVSNHTMSSIDAGKSVINTVAWSPNRDYIAFGGENAKYILKNLVITKQ